MGMSGNRAGWDDQDDGRLFDLLAEGLSAREIGERLHRSKNAVLARVRRRGWKLARPPIGGPKRLTKSEVKPRAAKPRSPQPPPVPPEALPPPAVPPSSLEVGPAAASPVHGCQFPLTSGRPWKFCGEPVARPGASWCETHRKIVWVRPPRWEAA